MHKGILDLITDYTDYRQLMWSCTQAIGLSILLTLRKKTLCVDQTL